jgi:hypothetical protein
LLTGFTRDLLLLVIIAVVSVTNLMGANRYFKEYRQLLIDNLNRELRTYLDYCKRVTQLQAQRDRLVHGTLNVVGPQMEKNLSAIMESTFGDGIPRWLIGPA